MHDGVPRCTQVVGRHHGAERMLEGPAWVGEEACDPGQRLLLLGVEDVQDGADEQAVAGLLPVVPPLQRPFGVDQDVADVLDVADLVGSLSYLEQRVVAGRARVRSEAHTSDLQPLMRTSYAVFCLKKK